VLLLVLVVTLLAVPLVLPLPLCTVPTVKGDARGSTANAAIIDKDRFRRIIVTSLGRAMNWTTGRGQKSRMMS